MASIGRNLVWISCFMVLFIGPCCSQPDTLVQGQQLKDGQHLTSASGSFRLGFFSGTGRNRHVGIWYNRPDERPVRPVWVANRNTPIFDSSGVLMIGDDGHLKILHNGGQPIVLAPDSVSVPAVGNIKAVLLNSGNFVIREVNSSGSIKPDLWQSFDHPTDTLLPGMKLGINTKTGQNWNLTSWLSKKDPNFGSFTLGMDPNNTNQLIIWCHGEIYWISGLWLNGNFTLPHELSNDVDYHFSYHLEENEKFFKYFVYEDVILFQRLTLNSSGALWGMSRDVTHEFISCKYPFFYDGCFGQNDQISCSPSDHFKATTPSAADLSNDGYKFKESENLTLNECKAKCLNNCFCAAYASTNHHNNTGCQIWSGCRIVLDIQRYGNAEIKSFTKRKNCRSYGETYYDNFAESKSDSSKYIYLRHSGEFYPTQSPTGSTGSTLPAVWITISTIGGLIILASVFNFISKKGGAKVNAAKLWIWLIIRRTGGLFVLIFRTIYYFIREKLRVGGKINREQQILIHELERRDGKTSHELQFFSFESIASATNNFEATNKLGEGGFGPVYKGQLPDGQEVAIKRLSKNSGQGLVEFKNEAILIAKLQHTNLVRLVGCCIHKEEKMLIYEYMINKSLDFFLFDPVKKNILDWKKRFNIIQGIVQGLLYLHNYSRLRIIHRDLKASNILLDNEMNPKISDFGMARIFGSNDSEANTNRVVGTYGYMSPEYIMDGVFSTKSDVFSFGVLLLEILSGQKSYSSYHSERPLNLIGYAWELWGEGRGLEFIDPILGDSNQIDQVLRCLHVGLLCVQESPIDRPAMLDVIFMIYNEANKLSAPKQPAFFIRQNIPEGEIVECIEAEIVECIPENHSTNKMSISEMKAR